MARVDITSKTITDIFPLGFKDYSVTGNEIDVSNEDGQVELKSWNVKGVYMPDGIAVMDRGAVTYVFTVNEGDDREYDVFEEAERINNLKLDPTVFVHADALKEIKGLASPCRNPPVILNYI